MAKMTRERISVHLRGLAPALEAEAAARHLTVSEIVRAALLATLPPLGPGQRGQSASAPSLDTDRLVCWRLRLHCSVAARLSARATECGLSRNAYITTLFEKTPAPPLALVKALAESTDRLAVVAADASEMLRLLHKDVLPSDEEVKHTVRAMVDCTRRHLELASRVVAELKPPRALPVRSSQRDAGQRSRL